MLPPPIEFRAVSNPSLEIKDAGEKGRGVFATAPIRKGELIARMGGWVVPTSQLNDDWWHLQIDQDLWLCSPGDQLDDCINHSCEPNAGFVTGEPALHALRDIAPGEEIAFDYSTSLSQAGWNLQCCCGSPRCRTLILPWPEMPESYRTTMRHVALAYLRAGCR